MPEKNEDKNPKGGQDNPAAGGAPQPDTPNSNDPGSARPGGPNPSAGTGINTPSTGATPLPPQTGGATDALCHVDQTPCTCGGLPPCPKEKLPRPGNEGTSGVNFPDNVPTKPENSNTGQNR